MRIVFRTNLDLHPADQLPEMNTAFNETFVPRVGDLIESPHTWRGREDDLSRVVEFQVCKVTIKWDTFRADRPVPYVVVEYHLPKHRWQSLTEFYNWYQPLCGRQFI